MKHPQLVRKQFKYIQQPSFASTLKTPTISHVNLSSYHPEKEFIKPIQLFGFQFIGCKLMDVNNEYTIQHHRLIVQLKVRSKSDINETLQR